MGTRARPLMEAVAIGDNPAMSARRLSSDPLDRFRARMRPAAMLAALAVLAGCGYAQWPLPRDPVSINRPPANSANSAASSTAPAQETARPQSSAAFVGAGAVIAGRGDTVYGLSRRHRVPVRAIIEANHLRPPYHLNEGQRVVLPRGRQHRVVAGDTLYGIARTYGVDPYALARANGLTPPYDIKAGESLVLPVADRDAVQVASIAPPRGTSKATADAAPPRPKSRPAAVPTPPPPTGRGFIWPVKGPVVSGFGTKAKGLRNDGINIAARRGTPVVAAENGVVAYAGNELRGFGNLLLIKHAGGWVTAYAHNDTLTVKRGDRVRKGQQVATVGSTGSVREPQLHFEMRRGRRSQDPKKHLTGA